MKETIISTIQTLREMFDVADISLSEGISNIGTFYIVTVKRYDGSNFTIHICPGESEKAVQRRLVRTCERELNKIGV